MASKFTFLAFVAVIFISVAFASASVSASLDKETTDELFQQLSERRDQLRSWFLTRVFGTRGREEPIVECPTCHLAMTLALSFLEQGNEEELEAAFTKLCADLDIVDSDVCDGIVKLEFPHIYYILTSRTFTVPDLCGFLLQNNDCGVMNETLTSWDIVIDGNKPPLVELPELPTDLETVKILHLTDIHPDIDYAEGSLTECTKPMCCRRGETWEEPWNSTVEAGHYGAYTCDIPIHTMQNVFNTAAAQYEYKFVMLGGDYVHHAVWNTTHQTNLDHYSAVADAIKVAFPTTPVYPVVGNHEPHPVNLFPPSSIWETLPEFDNSYVFNELADRFMMNEANFPAEAVASFRKAGYYSISPEAGLRVLVLNTNFCYILNFWLLFESQDPEGQLQWFADELQKAEVALEKVFIVGHVPPGSNECWSVWNEKFNRVVNRYENIIVGQFYGHTHNDDFKIFFDDDEEASRPNGVLYIGSSATTYTDLNPGYKVFHVDGARPDPERTWEIYDHESFIYNLTLANEAGSEAEPTWFRLYSAKESYGLASLRPAALLEFVLNMAQDPQLFQKFYSHFNKAADTMLECGDWDNCRRDYLCSLLKTNDADKTKCELVSEFLPETPTTPAY